MSRTIKVKAYAVLLDPSQTKHAVWVGQDHTKQPPRFHRLLGGHVEFGEHAADAVRREIAEELCTEVATVTLLGVVEDMFDYAGALGHEVAFVYAAEIAAGVVPEAGGWFDDGGPIRVEWRPVDAGTEVPLYPDGTQRLMDAWIRSGLAER